MKDVQEQLAAANRQVEAMLRLADSFRIFDSPFGVSVANKIEQNLLEALGPVFEHDTMES